MNCGNSATKNTASFGFASDVSSPSLNARVRGGGGGSSAILPRPAGSSPLRSARRSNWIPSHTNTHAPTSFSARNAISDAATSAEIPAIDSSAHATTPIELPAIVSTPARSHRASRSGSPSPWRRRG